MLPSARSPLGSPGVFALPEVDPPALNPQRMDVCAFVGVAPRGPAWQPVVDQDWPSGYRMVTDATRPLKRSIAVPVRSFDEYQRLFGGFEGPGLLPYAVASYFEQGGRRAWIVRIVHAYARATTKFADHCSHDSVNGLFTVTDVSRTLSFILSDGGAVEVDRMSPVGIGSSVRFTDSLGESTLSMVTGMQRVRDSAGAHIRWRLKFDIAPLAPVTAELVEIPLGFLARNEGSWGDRLRVQLAFTTTAASFTLSDGGTVEVDPMSPLIIGSTVRFTDSMGGQTLSLVTGMQRARDPTRARTRWRLEFDIAPLAPARAELVQARIEIDDGAGRREAFEHLALAPDHPDSLANVLCERSELLWPHPTWAGTRLVPADVRVELLRGTINKFSGGEDTWGEIVGDDFFDPNWTPADETPGDGISALAYTPSVTQLVLPDLYQPAQWAEDRIDIAAIGGSGAEFGPCADIVPASSTSNTAPSALTGLILDPRTSTGLAAITALQQRVLEFCDSTQNHIALVDVPPGLSQGRIEQWRAAFDSSYVAAYHPWLVPTRRNANSAEGVAPLRRQLPPSAVAAGIIARREFERGIQFGPANEIAREIIHFVESQPEGRADWLHLQNINCFVRRPGGISLVAARTLSRDSDWRQLSVRRLLLMLRRTLLVETQWAVFEPNGPALWRDLQHAIESLLRGLFRAGAFAGRTEAQSFFVRLRTEQVLLDRGELIVEIGVAPAEPLEFILVRLRRNGDGTLGLEE